MRYLRFAQIYPVINRFHMYPTDSDRHQKSGRRLYTHTPATSPRLFHNLPTAEFCKARRR